MKPNEIEAEKVETTTNIIALAPGRQKAVVTRSKDRFVVHKFTNKSGSVAWRVSGSKRSGERVQENYRDIKAAECRRIELEAEFHSGPSETTMRATRLSHEQIQMAEVAIIKLGEDWLKLLDAVDYWRKHGHPESKKDCPRLDEAVAAFLTSAEFKSKRFHTQRHLRTRVSMFGNATANHRLEAITVDNVEAFFSKRNVSARTLVNDRAALASFFKWCSQRPRQWVRTNPVRDSIIATPEHKTIVVASVVQCAALLKEAEKFKGGKLLPYVVGALVAGLRPFELRRMSWANVNLIDAEIVIEPSMTKTARKRVVTFQGGPPEQGSFNSCLRAWLTACEGKEFFPPNASNELQTIKKKVGIPAVVDIYRHTAISHFFRSTGSFGLSAEKFGNNEAVIKAHYLGKVSSEDSRRFYALRPAKGGNR